MLNIEEHSHRRYNPLNGLWILVSPHRAQRKWVGQVEKVENFENIEYDKNCALCPNNTRANGAVNPDYLQTYVFTNDHSALQPSVPEYVAPENINQELFKIEPAIGTAKVICYSNNHSQTLANMPISGIVGVINTWVNEFKTLGEKYRWVQIFENKGAVMGCSQPHPHGQIWASNHLPNEVRIEDFYQQQYFNFHRKPMLLDIAVEEIISEQRIVCENSDWLIIVPFWATWPFETLLLPNFPIQKLSQLTEEQKQSLAQILKTLLQKYDKLFNCSFPYSMGWHCAPNDNNDKSHWQLHAHFYPPLLRSATVKKFMVGYEMLAEAQRDLTPEQAAKILWELL